MKLWRLFLFVLGTVLGYLSSVLVPLIMVLLFTGSSLVKFIADILTFTIYLCIHQLRLLRILFEQVVSIPAKWRRNDWKYPDLDKEFRLLLERLKDI